jgi:DNA helicase-2/ATP-dependent DNA helicase PcrA
MANFIPSTEQQAIIETSSSALVSAGPGTGKTRTAIEKAIATTSSFEENSTRTVLFLSFSNAAVNRLRAESKVQMSRLQLRRVRFMTFHSLAAEILRTYGRFCGLPPRIRVMDSVEEKLLTLERLGVVFVPYTTCDVCVRFVSNYPNRFFTRLPAYYC